MVRRWAAALLALACLAAACGEGRRAAPPLEVVTIRGGTMGTSFAIKYVDRAEDRPRFEAAVRLCLERINRLFNTYVEDSVVSRFNALRHTEPVEVPAEFCREVVRALRIAVATDGAFDPTIQPVSKILPVGDRAVALPPSQADVERARVHVGYRKLQVVDATHLQKLEPEVAIDPNAFAKGYGVDAVAVLLESLGVDSYLVEIGGELRAAGQKPSGAPWRVGIEKPSEDGARVVAEVVALKAPAASIATSGNYRQFFESEGRRIGHIVDPRTGRSPQVQVVSATVRAADCAVADALATALMVTGPAAIAAIDAALEESFEAVVLVASVDAGGAVRRVAYRWSGEGPAETQR